MKNLTWKMKSFIGFAVILIISAIVMMGSLVENVPAGNICVIQHPVNGELKIYFEPGLKWQGFGYVTMYPRSDILSFLAPVDSEDESEKSKYKSEDDKSIKIQFNDSGSGWISGTVRYDYPTVEESMKDLHKKYRNHQNVINGLIRPNVSKVINLTGPLMSSIESSRTRRAEIPMYIEDQLHSGLYETVTRDVRVKDEITGQDTTNKVAEFLYNEDGSKKRQSSSLITDAGMNIYNFNMDKLAYEPKVLERLNALFTADSEKQLAYMRAIKAEQDNKTAKQEGEALATKSEWEAKAITSKEVEEQRREQQKAVIAANKEKETAIIAANKSKETAIIIAEQRVTVAELDKQASELEAKKILNLANAEAESRKMIMNADGALKIKIDAWQNVNYRYAEALQNHANSWVPRIVMGNGSSGNNSGVNDLINMLSVKAAQDLSLDMSMGKKTP